jgi:hypothetical protein
MSNELLKGRFPESLSCSVADKKIIWLSEPNKYLLVVPPMDKIIEMVFQGEADSQIIDFCINKMELNQDESSELLSQVKANFQEILKSTKILHKNNLEKDPPLPKEFNNKRFYRINEIVFFIEYETAELEYFIHPKFNHLEIDAISEFTNHFQLFWVNSEIVLMVNKKFVGSWAREMEHFMTGKVSMEILQKITQTEENDWMAVFHAAGISNGKQGILFLGDSGNGKSTLSAILMANGFDVLADDFLPVESKTCHLSSFPAAFSVKKNAIEILANKFPELKQAKEYEYPAFNKTVRYLSNPFTANDVPKKVPCKALIFVKYEANSGLQFSPLQKDIAFQKLVPDSWISPLESNAKYFLDWFGELPCWQLTYSDNEAMVKTVKKIFDNEL